MDDGEWEVEQIAAGSQVGGWEVQQQQQPQYQDLQQQQNPYQQQYNQQQQKHFQEYDQQPYDQQPYDQQQYDQQQYDQQQELYGQEKDQQYYAQFRAQIDQIQRESSRFQENYLEPSYQGVQGGGVERDDQQRLFGSEREFGELVDPLFQSDPGFHFGKEFGESDPLFHFGRDSVNLGQPVAWEEARKRLENMK